MPQPPLDLSSVFQLESHGPDTFVGESPAYSWGAIYGGLAVAQALWAATQTVVPEHGVHSLHAYFIRGGELGEPVRYEVDRVRNGRSFTTRRVVARQSGGAILTVGCSFQVEERGADVQAGSLPEVSAPEELREEFDAGAPRRDVPSGEDAPRSRIWTRYPVPLGGDPRSQACGLAYLSDLNPMSAIGSAYPEPVPEEEVMAVSLDHAVWFHRPARVDDEWLLLDLEGHGFVGTRGLATGLVFSRDGVHVATIAQEGLFRDRRRRGA